MILCLRFKFRFPLTSIVFFAHMMKIDGIKTVWLPIIFKTSIYVQQKKKDHLGF